MAHVHCDICGEAIYEDELYFEMPDGDLVCEDCLTEWAEKYSCTAQTTEEDEGIRPTAAYGIERWRR